MRFIVFSALFLLTLSHFSWFVRAANEAELSEAEQSMESYLIPASADTD